MDIGTGRLLDAHAGEEGAGSAGVVASAVRTRRGFFVVKAAENLDLVLQGFERFHGAAELEIGSIASGPPGGGDGAVGEIDEAHAKGGAGGGSARRPGRGCQCTGREERF